MLKSGTVVVLLLAAASYGLNLREYAAVVFTVYSSPVGLLGALSERMSKPGK